MIILKLYLDKPNTDLGIWFEGRPEDCSDGFQLKMPRREWEALKEPEEIQFVVSGESLRVSDGVIQ